MCTQVATCHLGQPSSSEPRQETLPFVLIQGPPGTGKTHTVKGVLNVWHLVHYQRYYNSLVASLTADARAGVNMESMQSALDRRCVPDCLLVLFFTAVSGSGSTCTLLAECQMRRSQYWQKGRSGLQGRFQVPIVCRPRGRSRCVSVQPWTAAAHLWVS